MPAYWIARASIVDPSRYARYATAVPPVLARYGGRILARGGPFQVLEGTSDFTRFVVVEFPSLEAAVACHASADYQAAASHRRDGAGIVDIAVVEGVETST